MIWRMNILRTFKDAMLTLVYTIVVIRIVGRIEAYFKRQLHAVRQQHSYVMIVSRCVSVNNAYLFPPTYLAWIYASVGHRPKILTRTIKQ